MSRSPGPRGRGQRGRPGKDYVRRNERIRAPEVRVIGPDGKQVGVMHPREALKIARSAGLDLIEVSPTARPPVCRILDYGKFQYEESKRKKDNKQTTTKLKEIKLRVSIDAHDFVTKLRRAEEFLNEGNKVKVTLSFRGRENEHRELGFERVNKAVEELSGVGTPDSEPRLVGRNVTLILSPLPSNKRKLKFNLDDEALDEDAQPREKPQQKEKPAVPEADEGNLEV